MIDLHAHSTASDGQHPPAEVVALAWQAGVRHLALTDHDSVGGLAEAQAAARQRDGMELICGIEVSTVIAGNAIHVLGHFLRPEHPALVDFTQNQLGERRRRMIRMIDKLNALGHAVTLAQVERIAGSDNLCRPHLARALVESGICRSVQDAFNRLIGDDGPAYADQERLEAKDAIAVIRSAGGVATLAHPSVDGMERYHIGKLREAGLGGLEVFHPDHDEGKRRKYLNIARELDLVPTGGSDFHGDKVAPDRAFGSSSLEPQYLAALRARAGG